MGSSRTDPRTGTGDGGGHDDLVAMANTLATALRNIAIYPAAHPRFATAAAELVERMVVRTQGCRPLLVGQRDNQLVVDNVAIPARSGQPAWLLQRFRDAGLRAVAFTAACTVDDVVAFGTTLRQARQGTPFLALWPADHERVRVHDLVFAGDFVGDVAGDDADAATGDAADPLGLDGGAAGGTGTATRTTDAATLRQRRTLRERLAADGEVTARLATIEERCGQPADGASQEFDLLTAVTALLPADVATQPELLLQTVRTALDRMAVELPVLLQRGGQIQGADVLRLAMGVARKYFRTEVQERQATGELPSGRPGDDAVAPDLAKLLEELAALPTVACPLLPAADALRADAPLVAKELLGIHLHTFANTTHGEVRAKARQRLVRMFADLDQARSKVVEAYLGRPQETPPVGVALHTELLEMLVEAGRQQLVQRLGHVDAAFVAKGFPESLGLAARVFGTQPEHRATLREGLESLALVIAAGGATAAAKTGVLRDVAVVEMLLPVGGAVANRLLQEAAQTTPEIRRRLVAHLLAGELPPAEAAALRAFEPADLVPVPYLRELLRAQEQGRIDAKLRASSAAILRDLVTDGLEHLPEPRLVAAIRELRHLADPETRRLLETLAAHRRLRPLDPRARAIRRCASQVLEELDRNPPS